MHVGDKVFMNESMSEQTLNDKVILVTGAARRIGAAIVTRLHNSGARVAIHHRGSADEAEALAKSLNRLRDGSAISVQADLLQLEKLPGLIDTVVDWGGQLDGLVNNASSFYPTPLASTTEQQFEELVGSNLKAPMFLSQAAADPLRRSQGTIVNIIDIHAKRPLRDHVVYGVAKAGLAMLTRSLAKDLAPEVRVNGVSPGAILWPEDGMTETMRNSILKQIPLQRAGNPDDVADCVLYLIRDARYVTGQTLTVDGGRSIGW